MIKHMRTAYLLPTSLLFASLTTASRPCYNPDRSLADGDVECNTTAPYTTCCGASYACLSNNLCVVTSLTDANSTDGYQYARGTCTDQSWESDACPKFCNNPANGDVTYSGEFMQSCNVTGEQSFVCLNGNDYNCETGQNVVTFSGPAPTYVYNPAQTNSRETPTASGTTTAISTTTSSSSATSTNPPSSGGSSSAVSIGVGVGVGVPLGLAALFLAFYLYRRNVKAKARHQAIPSEDPNERKEPALYGGGRTSGVTSPAPRYSDLHGHGEYEMQKTQQGYLGELSGGDNQRVELEADRERRELP